MKLLKTHAKMLKCRSKLIKKSKMSGGSINHLINDVNTTKGNVTELKKQLSHMIVGNKPKKPTHRINF